MHRHPAAIGFPSFPTRPTWIRASGLLGLLLVGALVQLSPPDATRAEESRAEATADGPRYRKLPASGGPRRLLQSPPTVLTQNVPRILALAAMRRGSSVVAVNEYGVLRRFDLAGTEEEPIRPAKVQLLTCAAIGPRGDVHATVNLAGNVVLIDAASGRRELPSDPFGARTTAMLFSPDGKHLASATSAGRIRIWNVADAKLSAARKGLPGAVQFLAFSPDGDRLACGSMEGDVQIHSLADAASSTSVASDANRNTAVVFSPDGRRLAIGKADGTIRVVDLASNKQTTLGGHTFAVWSVAFDPWHGRLASASWDGTIKIWDATSNALMASYKGHEESVSQLTFTSQGGLVSASLDRTLK